MASPGSGGRRGEGRCVWIWRGKKREVQRVERSRENTRSLWHWASGLTSGRPQSSSSFWAVALSCPALWSCHLLHKPACNIRVDCNHHWAPELIHCAHLLKSVCKCMQISTTSVAIPRGLVLFLFRFPGWECGVHVGWGH